MRRQADLRRGQPELVVKANELEGEEPSLRKIGAALFEAGYKTSSGKPYSASAVQSMLR